MSDRRFEIIQANTQHHAREAVVYDKAHRAVFNRIEQRRLNRVLADYTAQELVWPPTKNCRAMAWAGAQRERPQENTASPDQAS